MQSLQYWYTTASTEMTNRKQHLQLRCTHKDNRHNNQAGIKLLVTQNSQNDIDRAKTDEAEAQVPGATMCLLLHTGITHILQPLVLYISHHDLCGASAAVD